MSNGDHDDSAVKVTFTVKELLSEIRSDVKEMRLDLGKKADASEVIALRLQFDLHETAIQLLKDQVLDYAQLRRDVETLNTQQAGSTAVASYRTWLKRAAWGTVLTISITAINLFTRLIHWP